MTRQDVDRTLQRGLVLVYALALATGLSSAAFTPPAMAETIGDTGANLWGILVLLGGGICLAGVLVPRGQRGDWLGEFAGIWALVGAAAIYVGVIIATLEEQPGRLVGVFLLSMLAVLLVVRWFRVRDDMHNAIETAAGAQATPRPHDRT